MGIDIERVVGEHKQFLKCVICHDLIKDAVEVDCCKKRFCYQCLTHWLNQGNRCPACRMRCVWQRVHPVINEMMDTLMIKCQYASNGCTTVCQICKIDEHQSVCDYQMVECKNGCGLRIWRRHLTDHLCFKYWKQKSELLEKEIGVQEKVISDQKKEIMNLRDEVKILAQKNGSKTTNEPKTSKSWGWSFRWK